MSEARSQSTTSIEASGTLAADPMTVVAVGVLASTLAAVCHETLGHGIGCILDGGRITLLTSIYFRCTGSTALTPAAGPLGNLLAGMAAFALRCCPEATWRRHAAIPYIVWRVEPVLAVWPDDLLCLARHR
jgi:hypothetical protein